MIGQDIDLVFAVARIDQEIKAAVGILHSGEEISLPFGLL